MRKGYTLIEVLISLTIIGILFSFGFANFRDFSRRQALLAVARSMKGELRQVQSKASAGEKPAGCTTLSSYSFQVNATSYQTAAVCSNGSIPVKTESLSSGVTLTVVGDNPIYFKVLGQGITGAGAVITLTQTETGNVSTVTVTPGGEIK